MPASLYFSLNGNIFLSGQTLLIALWIFSVELRLIFSREHFLSPQNCHVFYSEAIIFSLLYPFSYEKFSRYLFVIFLFPFSCLFCFCVNKMNWRMKGISSRRRDFMRCREESTFIIDQKQLLFGDNFALNKNGSIKCIVWMLNLHVKKYSVDYCLLHIYCIKLQLFITWTYKPLYIQYRSKVYV